LPVFARSILKADHRAAHKAIERLMDAKPGTPAGDL
jgi:hypothetical protein